jgi:pimeloyl-ACP methyl ester carboxylesterase
MLPESRLVWFDECGHVPMMERAEDFAAEVRAFLDTLDERDRASGG